MGDFRRAVLEPLQIGSHEIWFVGAHRDAPALDRFNLRDSGRAVRLRPVEGANRPPVPRMGDTKTIFLTFGRKLKMEIPTLQQLGLVTLKIDKIRTWVQNS
ncbi:MAG: hypothetical protein HXX08_24115 [Chloroflexi bacterium]|uniref:Uncharacterized protein n=1 Tax=Candidatus Chlorohelix allophototropha TaxID=3003348 RepID=A0A8T7M9U3_9CHLR|nr:hypothetical protein [Chloroflexota bacterium]WJW68887.1 hypothetical protein OZ401_004509 [Chloroflexota bacterium L227-S17]